MDLQHELLIVEEPLLRVVQSQRFEELVHHEGLAAAGVTPDVNAFQLVEGVILELQLLELFGVLYFAVLFIVCLHVLDQVVLVLVLLKDVLVCENIVGVFIQLLEDLLLVLVGLDLPRLNESIVVFQKCRLV